uniref:UDP-glucuronosyltransferase n=1 Tax=Anoplophora glabripennis TaxID=217634 RepID=V5H0N4_ANOGL
MCKLIILIFVTTINFINGAKILGVFPSPGYSQFILGEVLMTELARRGHDVTMISAYKPREELKNYRTILADDMVNKPQRDLFPREREHFINRIRSVHNLGYLVTENALTNSGVQNLIHSNETFDLVILEQFLNEAHMAFGSHFNAPIVLFSSIGISEWNSHLIGDIRLPSIVPVTKTHYTDHMSFFQRLFNSIVNVCDILYRELVSYPIHQEYIDKYFPKKMNLRDIIYNASLMLLNSHVSTTQPASLTTAVIEIGGFHVSSKKLPEDIQKFLDEAENGAILFSMGSNLNISNLPLTTLDNIMEMFSKMKQRVLLKYEDINLKNKPSNVLISKWLPQSDILEHRSLVAFVTHGGLLSVTEAVFHGVPMVGIPIFGDQRMNVARCVRKGIAVHLPFQELTAFNLHQALVKVLENREYQDNSRRNANIMRDRPVRPLNWAMYWIEYVLRHNGAIHLRNASLELYWFQLYLIDVIIFLMVSLILMYYLIAKRQRIKGFHPQVTQNTNAKKLRKKNKLKKY